MLFWSTPSQKSGFDLFIKATTPYRKPSLEGKKTGMVFINTVIREKRDNQIKKHYLKKNNALCSPCSGEFCDFYVHLPKVCWTFSITVFLKEILESLFPPLIIMCKPKVSHLLWFGLKKQRGNKFDRLCMTTVAIVSMYYQKICQKNYSGWNFINIGILFQFFFLMHIHRVRQRRWFGINNSTPTKINSSTFDHLSLSRAHSLSVFFLVICSFSLLASVPCLLSWDLLTPDILQHREHPEPKIQLLFPA